MIGKAGTLTCPASTGNQSVTGVGFTPDVVIFLTAPLSAAGYQAGAGVSLGFMASSAAMGNLFQTDASVSPATANGSTGTSAIGGVGAGTNYAATRVSMDVDGFTINWSSVTSGKVVQYLALKGLTGAKVARNLMAGSGNTSFTGVGFKPDAVLFLGAVPSPGALSIGAAMSSASRVVSATACDFASSPSKANNQQVTTKLVSLMGTDADYDSCDLVSMDSDGFTISHTSSSIGQYAYLALKGGTIALGVDTQKGSTGTKSKTGLGAAPAGILFASNDLVNSASMSTTSPARLSVGLSDAVTHGSTWWASEDGVGTSNTNARLSTTAALGMSTARTTTNAEAAVQSFDADGYTLNWTTADATAREFIYLSVGGLPPGPIAEQYGSLGRSGFGGVSALQGVNRASTF